MGEIFWILHEFEGLFEIGKLRAFGDMKGNTDCKVKVLLVCFTVAPW